MAKGTPEANEVQRGFNEMNTQRKYHHFLALLQRALVLFVKKPHSKPPFHINIIHSTDILLFAFVHVVAARTSAHNHITTVPRTRRSVVSLLHCHRSDQPAYLRYCYEGRHAFHLFALERSKFRQALGAPPQIVTIARGEQYGGSCLSTTSSAEVY